MKNKYLSISIVIATYNSSRTIKRCLQSIREQMYPQNKIEIIVADGGSTDATLEIAKEYGAQIYTIEASKQNAEYNKSIGINKATKEILLMLDHDNVMPHKKWLLRMTKPFIEHPGLVGVETLRYHYDPKSMLLDRYFALFGAGDPVVWYLGKADRLSYIYDKYNLLGKAKDCGDYYLVRFNPDNIPTIGANGFLVRRDILAKYAQTEPGKYFDMDVNVDLIRNGFNTYAFVKDSVLHLTGYGSVRDFLRRRLLFLSQYRFGVASEARKKVRRYGNLSIGDQWRLIWVIFICLTFVIPLYHSFCGWRRIHDRAWFLHPFLCASFVILYGWVIIKHRVRIYVKKFLG